MTDELSYKLFNLRTSTLLAVHHMRVNVMFRTPLWLDLASVGHMENTGAGIAFETFDFPNRASAKIAH